MIRLMFGADAPKLIQILTDEITLQKRAIANQMLREGIEFDQLTEEEQEVADEEMRVKEEAERIEREAQENAINARREEVVKNLIEPMGEYNFVMIWPHVGNDGISQIFNAVKETPMTVAGKPTKITLKDEDLFEMLYYSSWKYTDIELQELKKDEVQGFLFQISMGEEQDPIDIFLDKFYGSKRAPPGDEESLAMKLSTTIKIEIQDEEGEGEETEEEPVAPTSPLDLRKTIQENRKSQNEARKSRKSVKSNKSVDESKFTEHRISGMYVPENNNCKVLAMRILFPQVTIKHDLPEPEPIPPHLIVAFEAFKRIDVLQLASEWPEGTMRLGFFTSIEPENAKLLAKTGDQFDRILAPPYDAKLIVQVSRKKSEPLLSYSTLGPTYISPNTVVGEKECAALFPEDYDEPESEPEPEPVKKKGKKRGRGSKSSTGSKASTESSESGEGGSEENASEEGLEDVAEEEEEEEDADADDDISSFDPLAGYQEPSDLLGSDNAVPAETAPEVSSEADKATTTE